MWVLSCLCQRSQRSVLLIQYCAGDKIKKNEMGRACDMYRGWERHVQDFGGETWEKETTGET